MPPINLCIHQEQPDECLACDAEYRALNKLNEPFGYLIREDEDDCDLWCDCPHCAPTP